jgi:peptidyl-prolyl cis-trans isomerase SurA
MGRAFAALTIGVMLALSSVGLAAAATKVTVNGQAISDTQISQRVKLLQLEGNRGGAKAATGQLIDEAIMMQEAKRLSLSVSEAQVDQAVQSIARNLKVSMDNLRSILRQNAVSEDTLRDRLRASLAWQQVTTIAVMPRVQISDVDLEKQAAAKVSVDMSYDYILKEVLFVMPGGKGNASKRTAEANQYRKSFRGCDSAVNLSLSYTDAAVLDVGRRHATQMPEAIAKELAGLNVGGLTKPRVIETGVSMLAVCAKSVAEDTTFIKGNLRQEAGNAAMKGEVEAYLKELRTKAKISYQ